LASGVRVISSTLCRFCSQLSTTLRIVIAGSTCATAVPIGIAQTNNATATAASSARADLGAEEEFVGEEPADREVAEGDIIVCSCLSFVFPLPVSLPHGRSSVA